MAAKRDITADDDFYTNADFPFEIQVLDENGAPVNISGWSISWLMKKRADQTDAEAVIAKTTASGITITDGPNGICLVVVLAADTDSTFKAGYYVHEAKRTDTKRVIVKGLARVMDALHD